MRPLRVVASAALATVLLLPATAGAAAPAVRAGDIDPHVRALDGIAAANGGNRAAGLPGADATAQYIAEQLRAAGWQVRLEPVTFPFSVDRTPPVLGTLQHGRDFVTARGSASADVTGRTRTVLARRCRPSAFRRVQRGEIVILPFSECTPRQASERVRARGGVAIIADAGSDAFPLRPVLPGRITVPIVLVRTTSAVRLSRTRTPIRLKVDMLSEQRTASNVIAELPGRDGRRVVMAGGHTDSVPESPGLNDNGSGVAALLEAAKRLPSEPRRATIRLGFWTAEEWGLQGARAYVRGLSRAERRRISAYLNFDMVGSPNGVAEVYDTDDGLERLLRRTFRGREGETPLAGASDHAPFQEAGIPTGGLYTGGLEPARRGRRGVRDRCYHRGCDDYDNVDLGVLSRMASVAERVVGRLAR